MVAQSDEVDTIVMFRACRDERPVKYWLNASFLELDQLIPVAKAAEEMGFEGLTLADHLFFPSEFSSSYPYSPDGKVIWPTLSPWPDCWVSIAAMAQVTQRLRFSTGVFVAPLRDPFSLAKSIGTVARLADGRLSCGFGAGWLQEEFEIVGVDFTSRGARMDEMLEVLRLLWTGEMVTYHGKHFGFGPIQMRPPAPSVAILIGGNSRPALRRAARNDGWIGSYTDVEDVSKMAAEVLRLRDDAGRGTEPFQMAVVGSPRVAREANALGDIGIQAITVPAVALGPSWATGDVIAGVGEFAARWLS